jgi:acyl-CoA thioesterase
MADALFEQHGDRFVPSELTTSPWGSETQHGGPAVALAARAAELIGGDSAAVLRITADILRPIPMDPLVLESRVLRPGRRVQLVEVEVSDVNGSPLVGARVWLIRRCEPLDYPWAPDPLPDPPPDPEALEQSDFSFRPYDDYFGDALDKRLIGGSITEPGRAAVWFRLRVPLVGGEETSPLQRVSAMADSGNGISWALPFGEFLFINTDLTVHLMREPVGEWFALDSVSRYDRGGRGLAETSLFDRDGYLGRSHQALFVDRAGPDPSKPAG